MRPKNRRLHQSNILKYCIWCPVLAKSFSSSAFYKGLFFPVHGHGLQAECPTTAAPETRSPTAEEQTSTTTVKHESSWDTPARKSTTHLNTSTKHHDVEVFDVKNNQDSNHDVAIISTTTTTNKPAAVGQENLEDFSDKVPSNINIEIQNIFSFGSGTNNGGTNGSNNVTKSGKN